MGTCLSVGSKAEGEKEDPAAAVPKDPVAAAGHQLAQPLSIAQVQQDKRPNGLADPDLDATSNGPRSLTPEEVLLESTDRPNALLRAPAAAGTERPHALLFATPPTDNRRSASFRTVESIDEHSVSTPATPVLRVGSSTGLHSQRMSGQRVVPASGEEHSHALLQRMLPTNLQTMTDIGIQAAGIRHIGFGPLKKENQDEYVVHVSGFGGQPQGCMFAIFDGHGTYGRNAAVFCRQQLPLILGSELQQYYQSAGPNPDEEQTDVENIVSDAFVSTEQKLHASGVNISSSGTTASVIYQCGNRVWVAAAGDSRVLTLSKLNGQWLAQPLTLDHRPGRRSEKRRVEAAGGRVEPKKLASGKTVGEPRLWLQHIPCPGLLLSRSIGDEMASTVGCTARPEVTYMTLRPHIDFYLVVASDGVWDVLSNMEVCNLVVSAQSPEEGCQKILDAALAEWEERLAADNISAVVAQFSWGQQDNQGYSNHTVTSGMVVRPSSASFDGR